jgi:hypothetical protein
LKLSKDEVRRAVKIGTITPDVQREIRKVKLENNQTVLMQIADASELAEMQMAKLRDLIKERRTKADHARRARLAAAKSQKLVGDPVVPIPLGKSAANVTWEQFEQVWKNSEAYRLLLLSSFGIRERFYQEYATPLISPGYETSSGRT